MYVIISLLILGISYYLFKKASGSIDILNLNMSSYTFYSVFIWTFIGSILILYALDPVEALIPQNESIRLYGWMIIMYAMLAIPFGMLISSYLFKVKSMKMLIKRYQSVPIEEFFSNGDQSLKHVLYLFSFFSILIVVYHFILRWSEIPLVDLIWFRNKNYSILYQKRNTILLIKDYGSFVTPCLVLQANFIQIYAYIAYCYWKMTKKVKDLIWLIFMIFFSGIYLTYDLVKGRILFFLIGFLIINSIIGKNKPQKITLIKWSLLFIILIGLVEILFMGVLEGSGNSFSFIKVFIVAYETIKSRIICGQIINIYHSLNIFPDVFPFIGFSNTGRLIHLIFGLSYLPDYGIIIRALTNPTADFSHGYGHATTFFMGEAWANFGLVGILFAPLWVGFFIQTLHIFFLKSRKTPLHIGFYAMLTISFPILTNLKGFYYPVWLFQYAIMIIILLTTASILKSIHRKTITC